MACVSPLLAYRDKNGEMRFLNRDKWNIFTAEKMFGVKNVFFVPCGKCVACRLAKRKEYAVRCAMEAKEYGDNNCFITLTYDEEHNKGYLIKRDLQYFFKKLRNKGFKFRYFACGEYGSLNNRPHYHAILFGFRPTDLKLLATSETGQPLFNSDLISEVWNKGLISVQNFAPEVASYVAGYVNKKLEVNNSFLLMSKKPGLGYKYMLDHVEQLKDDDLIVDDFGSIKKAYTPRYFNRMCENLGIDLTYNKQRRLEVMSDAIASEMLLFGKTREDLLIAKKSQYERKERSLKRTL